MTAANDSDRELPNTDPWIIEGMMPIAVAHAEAAAKAAGLTIGEWLSQIIAGNTSPSGKDAAPLSQPADVAANPSNNDRDKR